MKICCIITTINPPTPAMHSWSKKMPVYVVPDKKTPLAHYHSSDYYLLDLDNSYGIDELPWNHYSRKNLGYLHAASMGYEYILDTDDDTFFETNTNTNPWLGTCGKFVQNTDGSPFVNIYKYRLNNNSGLIWPRGFPLDAIKGSNPEPGNSVDLLHQKVGITQYLIDGDTDVDAIHRLIQGIIKIKFNQSHVLDVLKAGNYCPFNSQLTLFTKECFPLLYLPHTVTFRFTDILRSIVAKRILDKYGILMAFSDSIGYQVRNHHDYLKDFESEIPCYLRVKEVWDALEDIDGESMSESILIAYQKLFNINVVEKVEIFTLQHWLSQLNKFKLVNLSNP